MQETTAHLELLDGLLEDLLEMKWKAYGKMRSDYLFSQFQVVFKVNLKNKQCNGEVFSVGSNRSPSSSSTISSSSVPS